MTGIKWTFKSTNQYSFRVPLLICSAVKQRYVIWKSMKSESRVRGQFHEKVLSYCYGSDSKCTPIPPFPQGKLIIDTDLQMDSVIE